MSSLAQTHIHFDGPVLLFDGLCNLSDGAVLFVIDRDPHARIRFASLQSERAALLLDAQGAAKVATGDDPMSIILIDRGRLFDRSSAVLRAAGYLSGMWPVLKLLLLIPRPLRDAVYNYVARNRFAWFGRRDSCRIPTPELRARFID